MKSHHWLFFAFVMWQTRIRRVLRVAYRGNEKWKQNTDQQILREEASWRDLVSGRWVML
jgi:hypothetical protein